MRVTLGSLFVTLATFVQPTYGAFSQVDEQKQSESIDVSNPSYLKDKTEEQIKAEIDKALEDPNSEFTQKLFSNPALKLIWDRLKLVIDKRYIDTKLAEVVAKRPDFSIGYDHMRALKGSPNTLFSRALDDNLNHRINKGIPTYVTDASFSQKVLEASKEKPVLIDFWAPWCGPCLRLGPKLDEIAKEYEEKVIVVKIKVKLKVDEKSIEENPEIMELGPYKKVIDQGIPAIMIIKNGFIVVENAYTFTDEEESKFERVENGKLIFDHEKFLEHAKRKISKALDKQLKNE